MFTRVSTALPSDTILSVCYFISANYLMSRLIDLNQLVFGDILEKEKNNRCQK